MTVTMSNESKGDSVVEFVNTCDGDEAKWIKKVPAEDEMRSDSDSLPGESVLKKERKSPLERVKKFFSRATLRVYGQRETSKGNFKCSFTVCVS